MPARFPIRWRWMMLVGMVVGLAVFVLAMVILDMEREAWLATQESQAEVLVDRLGDELKIPLLAGRGFEADVIVQGFRKKVPAVVTVYAKPESGDAQKFGPLDEADKQLLQALPTMSSGVNKLGSDDERLWFAKVIEYSGTRIGLVAVRFSDEAWKDLAGRLVWRMVLAAVGVLILSGGLIYWVAGRMSEPLELLAGAAGKVAQGDFSVQLPVSGNDEMSDAVRQFNSMVSELAHKEELRDVFGRYLNPKLVSEVFDGDTHAGQNRRQDVTVLFADMVSFTAFSEATETEEVVDVLNKHFEVFHRIITYFGGHVDKYIGDAVMAVFNHPHEHPEHARQATLAALAMVMACSKLGVLRKNGEPIEFRIGLNKGEVIVGNIGADERLEYTVIGNAVNVASRMGGLGGGSEVVMPQETYQALGDGFAFDDMGEQAVKGVSKPLRIGRVRAITPELEQSIYHAMALAFDLTLPSALRVMITDMEDEE